MFLVTSNVPSATPSYYLISGDVALYLYDTQSVQSFQKVGVPIVTLTPDELSSLLNLLSPTTERPWLAYSDAGATPLVDGGAPNSVLYIDDFNGGDSTTTTFGDPPINTQRVYLRRGNAADWTLHNPVLWIGEPGVELDTQRIKIGNGVSRWSDLPYGILNSQVFIPNTKLIISPTAPATPAAGTIWILCESGSSIPNPPPPPPPLAYSGTMAFSSEGALTVTASPHFSGTVTLAGTGTLTASGSTPPATTITYGAIASSVSQLSAQQTEWGLPINPWVWRYYDSSTSYTMPPYSLGTGEIWCISTTRVLPQSTTQAGLVTYFQKFPTDRITYYCPWHEPEDQIANGTFTIAQYKAGFHTARLAQQQVGNNKIKIAAILMDYDWKSFSGRNPEDYIPANADFDILFVDSYFEGSIGWSYTTIPTNFDPIVTTANSHGKPWGVTEAGVGQKITGTTRQQALTTYSSTIRHKGAVLGTYFATSSTSEWWLNSAEVAAWKAGWTG